MNFGLSLFGVTMKSIRANKVQVGDVVDIYGYKIDVDQIKDQYGTLYFLNKNKEQRSQYVNSHVGKLDDDEAEKFREEEKLNAPFFKIKQLRKPCIYIGSDPEIFVVGADSQVIPSYDFLKSKNENELTTLPKQFGTGSSVHKPQNIFWDGFQGEFNVQPQTCLGWFADGIYSGLKNMSDKAKLVNKDAKLSIQSTLPIHPVVLQNAKPEHVEFGCMPSLNIYGMEGLKADGRDVPFRSAGGHIHLGIASLTNDNKNTKQIARYVKTLDKILGVACVSLFAGYDKPERREMYGLAGEYRLPKHGIEYRTLSNAWLAHPLIMNMVYELARQCVGITSNNLEHLWVATEEETIRCINECDTDLAREILARNKYMFINIFRHMTTQEKALNLYRVFFLGMDSILDNTADIEGNWRITKNDYGSHCYVSGGQIGTIEANKKYKLLANEKVTEIYEELINELNNVETSMEETAPVSKKRTA